MIKRVRFYDEAIRLRLAEIGRADYDALVAPDGEPVHRTTRTVTYRAGLPPVSGLPAPSEAAGCASALYIKVYRPGARGWKFLLRPSKAWTEASNLRMLARWGVPAVRAVAIGVHRTWTGLAGAFLATEEWPGATTLAKYAHQHWPIRGQGPAPYRDFRVMTRGPISPAERGNQADIGRLLAGAVRLMHRHHFYHIDLQWRNVLVRRDGQGRWQVVLLDCPRGGWRATIPGRMHGQVCDLASLDRLAGVYLTRSERLRWLREYIGPAEFARSGRRLARRIISYRNRFERRRHSSPAYLRGERSERLTPLGD